MGIFGSPFFISYFYRMEWGLFGLFLNCFFASTILPFPSEASVMYFFVSTNHSPVFILTIATIGNCLGGATNYFLGRWSSDWVKKKITLRSEKLVNKYGVWTALISWLPLVGDPILIVLGIYKTRALKTLLLMTLGKAARYISLYLIYVLFQS